MKTPPGKARGVRWWPCVAVLVLASIAIAALQWGGDRPQQWRNTRTFAVAAAAFAGWLVWLLFASRLRWRTKLASLGVIAGLHLLVFACVRITGVDGNLVPIVEWRWAKPGVAAAPPATAPGSLPVSLEAEDLGIWPQFLGPTRDAHAPALPLQRDWTTQPPVELWRTAVGDGWSGFAVSDGRAITLEQRGEEEVLVCRAAATGAILWSHAWAARYSTTIGGTGPRTVPAVAGGRVVATGATGGLRCVRLDTGELIWARNVLEENDVPVPPWGYSVSPLVVKDRVVVSVGGGEGRALAAYGLADGELLWQAGDQTLSYSSPILAELDGHKQVVVFNGNGVAGHDPVEGRVLWAAPLGGRNIHVAAPLALSPDRVLFSAGYGHGSESFRIRLDPSGAWQAEQEWRSRRMKGKFANLVLYDGHVYGPDDGIFACISAGTGEQQWKDGRYGHGQMILTGDLLLMMAEDGHLVLIEPRPDALRELARVRVFTDKTWNPPALAGDLLFLRNDREAVCWRLPARQR